MNARSLIGTLGALPLAAALLLSAGAPLQAAEYWLRAEALDVAMPDGRVVPMWGFAEDQDHSFATLDDGAATVPGPLLTVPPGEGLTVHLYNNGLPEAVSFLIPAQALPTTDGTNLAPGVRSGGRLVSLAHQVAAGAAADFVWTDLRPGTYLYQSGSHMAVQVQMGLYGALRRDAAAGNAYGVPEAAYDNDLALVFSEIDPELHDAVAEGRYGPGRDVTSTARYEPRYFLVNGSPHHPGRSPLAFGAAGEATLLRLVNAGLDTHVPLLGDGVPLTLLAEDGNAYPASRETHEVELHAGQTVDVMTTVPGPGYYPLYDRRLALSNDGAPGGGMLAYLAVATPSSRTLMVAKTGRGTGTVAIASRPGGILCGTDCSEPFNFGTQVTLEAVPDPGSAFVGWSGGGCSGLGECVATMDSDGSQTVTAAFARVRRVRLLSPNGGERLPERSFLTIRWGARAAAETFTLWYSTNGGRRWHRIAQGVRGTSYVWELPEVRSTRNRCLVRVRAYNGAGRPIGGDRSNRTFRILDVP